MLKLTSLAILGNEKRILHKFIGQSGAWKVVFCCILANWTIRKEKAEMVWLGQGSGGGGGAFKPFFHVKILLKLK